VRYTAALSMISYPDSGQILKNNEKTQPTCKCVLFSIYKLNLLNEKGKYNNVIYTTTYKVTYNWKYFKEI
jgi:hypothetical protein